jgi:Mg2+/Co2+ transporter CorC
MSVDDAAALLRTDWDTEATTVAGLVSEALGHLPAAGETVTVGDFELEAGGLSGRAVTSVLARRLRPETEATAR